MRLLPLAVLAFGALLLGTSGCMTITNERTIVVTPAPGETKIAVTSKATTHCQDWLLFERCTLALDLHQVK